MPLHGKIVVIKRSGVDGTEFPLTATCLFGRKPDCDIRIQLPQVSKEHCRIDLNENKEIILTNLSSVNPTRVNGEALQQSERLKHGDVITVIDRSFRFEYPPPPTPKKRSSIGGKTETLKVLQNQQVGDTVATETGEKRISEVSTDPHLKDGTNHDNIQRPLEKTVCVEAKEDDGLLQSKKASPFNDLYQMIKKSLDVKTPRKSSASVLQTPSSKFCTPKPCSVRKNGEPVISTEDKSTPKKEEAEVFAVADEIKAEAGNVSTLTPKSVKKQRKSFQVPSTEMATSEAEDAAKSEATSPQKRIRTPPKRFTAGEVVEQSPKSPVRRRSKEAKPAVTQEQEEKVETVKVTSKKRKSEELGDDLPTSQMKRKRVSFGGVLCPELFDKRLPPDSPLRKGAAPRRSLAVAKPKQSLLRRASASGLLQDKKERSCSPKMRTPSPGKKSPKSRTPSPKAATAAKKSPKSKSPSPTVAGTPGDQTPKVQGRFSVSHISTPSPVAEDTDQVPLVTATPKVSLRRRSTSRETPGLAKSAAKVMRRRGGISRASMKVKNSWADIVRFGQTKALVVAPAKKTVISKMMKKTVSKPQTPARKPIAHVSTGHADSPVTIVVGRAHKQTGLHPTGAAPKLVTNIALFKKNMEMDEDLTGISEMLKTPVNEMRKRSVINENNAPKTPVGGLGTSVLNTPEETGEMMVSPLSVSSTVKDKSYNSEAVQRLFDDNNQESSTVIETPAVEDSSEQQCTDLKTASVATPNQKPELPVCVTGVKRIMKTPKQKAEPIEDLRGKILKTPKQKPVQQECLTGVKRIMKTPKQKAEPIEDLRGKILKTPKQKPEQQECLTGVKRMMTTPKREAEPVEDIKVELMTTPEQKPEQQECLTEVEIVCKTPQPESEPLEDQGKPLETPKALEAGVTTPEHKQESEDLTDVTAENLESSSLVAVQTLPDCDEEMAKELVFAQEEQQDDVPTDVIDDVPQVNSKQEADANEVAVDDHLEELSSGHDDNEPSDAVETIAQAAVDENVCVEKTEEDTVDEKIPEEQPTVDEKMPEEQPTVDEKIPEEQPTVDEKMPEEQPTVDEKIPEEQPTVDEKMPEEQPTVDEKMPEEQPLEEDA
ncbi:proliferation marker protein Ki-67 [Anoplopoma fimbria]|uniref:proliferation marker protein Ki-67 n=1 Tax=Anoplopoma fimbria TaxID=229290 RepID=UPI0023EC0A0D|nr:proliferation marker protein Ki-67 [Anoplopoma fimbria]